MKNNLSRLTSLVAVCVLATACATPDRITLLPQADGSPSAVVVHPKAGGELVLSAPYQTALVTSSRAETGSTTAAEVETRYKQLADALPVRAQSFLGDFELGCN